jgi:hypothetical protein
LQGSGEELDASAEGGADVFARECGGGEAGEAGGSGVAKDGFAGVGVVATGLELADGKRWGDEEVEGLEEGEHLLAEGIEALAEVLEFGGRDGGSED